METEPIIQSNEMEDDDLERSNIVKRLEDGEDPEKILKDAYEEGTLTVDLFDRSGADLMEYGLTEDKYEYYEGLARSGGRASEKTLEEIRSRADEEPEAQGFESNFDKEA